MSYETIMDKCRKNYMNGENVRVIETFTDSFGNRKTIFRNYCRNSEMSIYVVEKEGDVWQTYDIDYDVDYGSRNYHDFQFLNEADALAHIAAMSDYALAH